MGSGCGRIANAASRPARASTSARVDTPDAVSPGSQTEPGNDESDTQQDQQVGAPERRHTQVGRRIPGDVAAHGRNTCSSQALLDRGRGVAGEDRLLLLLEALRQSIDVVRVLQEALEGRDDDRRREVRASVPVEELGDVLGLALAAIKASISSLRA
jgi:hypothetical protein